MTMNPTISGQPRKTLVRNAFRGAWAGLFVGSIGFAGVLTGFFLFHLVGQRSGEFAGSVLTWAPDETFAFLVDIRPGLAVTVLGALSGAVLGMVLSRRSARR